MIFTKDWPAEAEAARRRQGLRVVDNDGSGRPKVVPNQNDFPPATAAPVLPRLRLALALAAVLIGGGCWIAVLLIITAAPAYLDPGPLKLAHQAALIILGIAWGRLGYVIYQRVAHPPPPETIVEHHHHHHGAP